MREGIFAGVTLALALGLACGGRSTSPAASGETDGTVGGTGTGSGSGDGSGSTGGTGTGSGSACSDTLTDPKNCGTCGVVCSFGNAATMCASGKCVRGACASGWYDLDGDPGNGCEASCTGTSCTASYGTLVLSAPPLPDTGIVASAFASSGPVDTESAPGPTLGILGEPTPLPYCDPASVSGDGQTNSSLVVNLVGYGAVLR
jgi:hypothetical protein